MNYLSHLECSGCGKRFAADRLMNLCPECSKVLLVRYDLKAAAKSIDRNAIFKREPTLWRYRELLPVNEKKNQLSLGEGYTSLVRAARLGEELGFNNLFIKDEGLNPTGSFKARGLSIAVSKAKELGVSSLSIPSAGNAAGAMSAYAALAGIEAYVFMPRDVPQPFVSECRALGANVTLINGLITVCGKIAADGVKKHKRFDVSTLKEPYRLEGKKTMGYELAEQFNWTLPDVIIYPTGGGTGLVGMWKAFDEMNKMGWIKCKKPRMVTVQAEGCAPMVKAFHDGKEAAEPWPDANTLAAGLRVPAAVGDYLIIRALRESEGTAVAVPDDEIMEGANLIGRTQGLFVCPETGATAAALKRLLKDGWIGKDEKVVLFNTGSGHKYSHLWETE